MNSNPANNGRVVLDESRERLVVNAAENAFAHDPMLLENIDRRLSSLTQISANRTDPATYPTGPGVPAPFARDYELPTTGGIPGYGTLNTDEVAGARGTYLFQAFNEVAALVNSWSPDEESRVEVYRAVHAKIAEVVEKKRKDYADKMTAIDTAANSFETELRGIRDRVVTTGTQLRASNAAVAFPQAEFDSIVDTLNLTNDQIRGRAVINIPAMPGGGPVLAITLNNLADISTLRSELVTRFATYQGAIASAGYAPIAPPVANDPLTVATGLSVLNVTNQLSTLETAYRTNLTDHANRNLLTTPPPGMTIPDALEAIRLRSQLLSQYHAGLQAPSNEELIPQEDRFKNCRTESAADPAVAPFAVAGQPWVFFNPVLGPVPGNPNPRGQAFSAQEYASYYRWVIKNQEGLSPEKKQAVDANAEYVMQNRINTQMPNLIAHLRTLAGGAGATAISVQDNVGQAITDFINNAVPGVPAGNFGATPAETNAYLSLVAWQFKLDIKDTPADLRKAVEEKLQSELVARFNLPNEAEQKNILSENRTAYARVEGSRNLLNSLFRMRKRARNRRNYLGSIQTVIYNDLKAKYSKEDFSNPEVQSKMTAELVQRVMQARLETLNEMNEAMKEPTWFKNMWGKIKEMPGGYALTILALSGVTITTGALLNPQFFAPFMSFVTALPGKAWNAASAFAASQGGWGSAFLRSAGVLSTFGLGYKLASGGINVLANSLSSAATLKKERVMGGRTSLGQSQGGIGNINSGAATIGGVYDAGAVQRRLASQLTLSRKYGATLASTDADDLQLINSPKFKSKFKTADYLWEREKQGLRAVVNSEITRVQNSADEDKVNRVLVNTLSHLYGPNGTETTFMRAMERSASNRGMLGVARFGASAAVGAGLGSMFAVTF